MKFICIHSDKLVYKQKVMLYFKEHFIAITNPIKILSLSPNYLKTTSEHSERFHTTMTKVFAQYK
jgi:hypothetical protein